MILVALLPFSIMPLLGAQPTPHYVMLYAHSFGASAALNALPQWGGEKAADMSKGLTFKLNPTLGRELRIYGAITFTLYLRASGTFFGTISAQILELAKTGTETAVPSAKVDTGPINLKTTILPVTVGVGIVDYQFEAGSAILLRVMVEQGSGSGVPLLVWDDSAAQTSVRLPAVSPTSLDLTFSGQPSYGRVFEADTNGTQVIEITATVADVFGVYRFAFASFTLTAPDGTNVDYPQPLKNDTDYTTSYSTVSKLTQGMWQIRFSTTDTSGESYSSTSRLWISPFYEVTINLIGSDGTYPRNATLIARLGNETSWTAVTNATGSAIFSLPSSQIVGPLNLTISWLGTQTLLPLDIERASTFLITLPVFGISIQILMNVLPIPFLNAIPVPGASVTLYQQSQVQKATTGIDGVANFKTIPAGNYTVRVDYLFATYNASLNVKANGVTTFFVPFPHRTITLATALALVALTSVVVVNKKRGRVYPRSFSYFNELTHGGLPESCFVVIAGPSGSGKTVLLNTLAGEHMSVGKSIYITNSEYPERILENLKNLGITQAPPIFIDAYSAIGGGASKEPYSIGSHTDLTNLGMIITKCLETAGPKADVYFDSLGPIVTMLRMDYLVNFLQSVAARVKANNGKLCATVGAGLERQDLAKLEESSDCVIETQLQESGKGQRRRLRIKKLRGKPYDDRWTRFQVEQGRGIVFLTTSKPAATLPS